ncbi:MAG: DNA-binding MarR family transcriptional regulator [Sulfurimonas sp.]|jgi:DNA-binding MarR family transcriptional regulator|uniref:MarR family winged helix-turn-helix transcriptional regulator n=1 Tax=Sulfurimonas sp. TaxID=2022749 RepID=UPI0039E637B0
MNANELKVHLNNNDICSTSEIGHVTLPLLMLSQRLFSQIGNLLSVKYNLSNSELDVLASLHSAKDENHTLTPTRLYERLFFSSGGMTKVLKKLETKKFINRITNKDDKRSKMVQLTKDGKIILEESLPDVIELEEAIFSDLDSQDRKHLSSLLFKVLD